MPTYYIDSALALNLKIPYPCTNSKPDSFCCQNLHCAKRELWSPSCYQQELLSSLTWISTIRRQGFNRQNEGTGNVNTSQQRANGSPNPSPTTFSPTMPPLSQSSSFPSNPSPNSDNIANSADQLATAEPLNIFFREKYAKLGVKGNFMPLAARPANVDLADWLAHQSLSSHCHLI